MFGKFVGLGLWFAWVPTALADDDATSDSDGDDLFVPRDDDAAGQTETDLFAPAPPEVPPTSTEEAPSTDTSPEEMAAEADADNPTQGETEVATAPEAAAESAAEATPAQTEEASEAASSDVEDGGQDLEWNHALITQPLGLLVRTFSVEYEHAMTQQDALGGTVLYSTIFGMRTLGLAGEYSRYFLGDFGRGLRVSGLFGFASSSVYGDRYSALTLGLEAGGKFTFKSGVALTGDVGVGYSSGFFVPALGFGVGYAF